MTLVGPLSLAKALRRTVVAPRSVAALLADHEALLQFRRLAHDLFPDEAEAIWNARLPGEPREVARAQALVQRVQAHFFPLYECDEYDQLVWRIPFLRLGWSLEDYHDLERRQGELLLLTLCRAPVDARVPLLEWARTCVSHNLLRQIPEGGFPLDEVHVAFDDTSCSAVADFAAWLWGETGSVFLDVDDEIEVVDAEWTRENVLELTHQWRQAEALLDRVEALAEWLEADPVARFHLLVEAALGQNTHLVYQRSRRLYELEITERGLVCPREDDGASDPLALPVGVAP